MDVLETERLILRDLSNDDLLDFFEYASNKEVATSSGWLIHKSIDESKEILKRLVAKQDVFAIIYKQNNKMIGTVGLHDYSLDFQIQNKNQLSIGYSLSNDYWSKGLMTEAIVEVMKYAFNVKKVDCLWASHIENNLHSMRILENLGFKFIHRYNKSLKPTTRTYEALAYVIERSQFDDFNQKN